MDEKLSAQQVTSAVLAIVVWLLTFALGLNCIYLLKEIFFLIFNSLGGSMITAERIALGLVFILGLAFTIFIIGTAEYHRKHFGKRESWRLFAWSLAVEASITILYYIL
jgi:hypothetical protein